MASDARHAFDPAAWLAGFVALGGGWAIMGGEGGEIRLGFHAHARQEEIVREMIDQLYADQARVDAVFAAIKAHRAAA